MTGSISNMQEGEKCLKVSQVIDGNFKNCEQIKISNDAINSCMSILDSGNYTNIVDFDNHLDNIKLDWTNAEFEKLL